MQINSYFDPRRLYLLIKKDFYTQYKTYLIALGAIFGILVLINIVSNANLNTWNFHAIFYPLTLFIGGFIFTSQSFRELSNENSLIFYLSLPASNLEKFISKLIISSIGYVLVSLVVYFLFSLTIYISGSLLFGHTHQIFIPFHHSILTSIHLYLVIQSIFLLGAIYFRKSNFIKTILSIFVFTIIYQIFIAIIVYILFSVVTSGDPIYFPYEIFNKIFIEGDNNGIVLKGIIGIEVLIDIAKILFWYILAPLMWLITYFRLKESGI